MKIKVIGKRVLAKEIKPPKKEGVLIIPEGKKTEQMAKVEFTGTECSEIIKDGETILIRNCFIERIYFQDQEYMLVPLNEVIGVVQ